MIREATQDDLERLVEMGQRFVSETEYRELLEQNPAQMWNMARRLVDGPNSTVLVAESDGGIVVGMIGVLLFPHHFSGALTAGEVMWWLEPEYRGHGAELLTAAEQWAAEAGAELMQLVAPNIRVGHLYQRRGYRLVEMAYQKPIAAAVKTEVA